MTVAVLPDVERIVSTALRSATEVPALVDDRIYTELPRRDEDRVFPLVRLGRIGGGPTGHPPHTDAALLQLDVWGGSKYQARELAATIVKVLAELDGYTAHGGYIVGTSPGAVRYLPDETFTPTRPRYVVEALVYSRPTP